MTTRVFLLRHGETAAPTVFHGAESDIGLSDKGVRQAAVMAPILAALRPDVVVSSGMRRAIDTATPIAAACGLPLLTEPAIHERRVGSLSGTPFNHHEGIWADTVKRWSAGETGWSSPGAESFDDIHARVMPVWQRLTEAHAGKTLVVVAHGLVCKVLLLSLLPGWSVQRWTEFGPIRNVGISELILQGEIWQPVRLNEWHPAIFEQNLMS
jgi:probable phosphoglycerate mutase